MIIVANPHTGVQKEVKRGFSWTMLFFGFLVPLLRGDIIWTIASLVLAGFTYGISWLILPFFYNKIYLNSLLNKGFKPVHSHGQQSQGVNININQPEIGGTSVSPFFCIKKRPLKAVSLFKLDTMLVIVKRIMLGLRTLTVFLSVGIPPILYS